MYLYTNTFIKVRKRMIYLFFITIIIKYTEKYTISYVYIINVYSLNPHLLNYSIYYCIRIQNVYIIALLSALTF